VNLAIISVVHMLLLAIISVVHMLLLAIISVVHIPLPIIHNVFHLIGSMLLLSGKKTKLPPFEERSFIAPF
jgi:hypothetical protein